MTQCLFIDEAYRLSEGKFAKEAMDEIVDCLTKEKYRGHIVVIIAGYEEDINKLLSVNRGLASRFTEELCFPNLPPPECFELLTKLLKRHGISLEATATANTEVVELFRQLSAVPGWGNARDVGTLAKKMTSEALKTMDIFSPQASINLSATVALRIMHDMLISSTLRANNKKTVPSKSKFVPPPSPHLFTRTPSSDSLGDRTSQDNTLTEDTSDDTAPDRGSSELLSLVPFDDCGREPDVSDETWDQLQADKEAERQAALELESLKESVNAEDEDDSTRQADVEAGEIARQCVLLAMHLGLDSDSLGRVIEVVIDAAAARGRSNVAAARIEELEDERQQGERIQHKLLEMGVCPSGRRWIKQAEGYRCSGGAHYVSHSALGV